VKFLPFVERECLISDGNQKMGLTPAYIYVTDLGKQSFASLRMGAAPHTSSTIGR
jgi:hypothetical protein